MLRDTRLALLALSPKKCRVGGHGRGKPVALSLQTTLLGGLILLRLAFGELQSVQATVEAAPAHQLGARAAFRHATAVQDVDQLAGRRCAFPAQSG